MCILVKCIIDFSEFILQSMHTVRRCTVESLLYQYYPLNEMHHSKFAVFILWWMHLPNKVYHREFAVFILRWMHPLNEMHHRKFAVLELGLFLRHFLMLAQELLALVFRPFLLRHVHLRLLFDLRTNKGVKISQTCCCCCSSYG